MARETSTPPLFTNTFSLPQWADEFEEYDDETDPAVRSHSVDWAERDSTLAQTAINNQIFDLYELIDDERILVLSTAVHGC